MRRIDRLRAPSAPMPERLGFQEWVDYFKLAGGQTIGVPGPTVPTTWGKDPTESMGSSFTSYVSAGYQANGVVFAVILARLLLFTEARFLWQRLENSRPGDLFGTADLAILERPWPNGTTGDLLARMEQDASLAGNFYGVRRGDRLRRLRPDRVQIVLGSPTSDVHDIDLEPVGYAYWPKGIGQDRPTVLMPEEVVHYAPIPDPGAQFRGMSWLTPVVEEVRADSAATRHKGKFFDNAATPNLAVSLDKALTRQQFVEFVEAMKGHEGAANAYKTLWLGGGADVKVVGADLKQLDFKLTQGAGETRICAAGGVPPIIVGLSEGLSAATYSNYGMARRKFGDHWARPSWRSAAAALESVLPRQSQRRLWYDDRDIPFLQEDQADAANILKEQMLTIESAVRAGYTPESATAAVTSGNLALLEHTGLYSVQLQPPGTGAPAPA